MSATPDVRAARRSSSHRMPTDAFLCGNCGLLVAPEGPGTLQRNHCPRCLHSLHLDLAVGDRRSLCRGLMAPISTWIREGGEVALIHRCTRCGTLRSNRTAGDDDLRLLAPLLEAARAQVLQQLGGSQRRDGP